MTHQLSISQTGTMQYQSTSTTFTKALHKILCIHNNARVEMTESYKKPAFPSLTSRPRILSKALATNSNLLTNPFAEAGSDDRSHVHVVPRKAHRIQNVFLESAARSSATRPDDPRVHVTR